MADLAPWLEELRKGIPDRELRAAYISMSENWREGDGTTKTSGVRAVAYAEARMPATVAAMEAVLGQLPQPKAPLSVLDLGAGTGTVPWALSGAGWQVQQGYAIEKDLNFLEAFETLTQPFPEWQMAAGDICDIPFPQAEVATASYSLGEIPKDKLASLLGKCRQKGVHTFIVTLPGTKVGYQRLLTLRDIFLQLGADIYAPCPHIKACPMQVGDWCHFSRRLPRTRLHRLVKGGDLGFEDEKFAYLVAFFPESWLAQAPRPQGRIVKNPRVKKGETTFEVCTASGTLAPKRIQKREKSKAKVAKKLSWGDPWPWNEEEESSI